jgi:simple sugar transport system substrate-binding protein
MPYAIGKEDICMKIPEKGGLRAGFFLVWICAWAPVFLSCQKSSEAEADQGIILGFSQIGAESAWRHRNTRSVQEAAAGAGIQLLFSNAEQKQENQIKAIRSFIAYQVDVIAFVPIVADGWDNVLQEAKDAGIPVLVADRKINVRDESLYKGFIGTDSLEEGRNAGRFLLKKFRNRLNRAEPIRIVELSGTVGSSVATGRAQGFREALAPYPQFRIVFSESGDFLRSKGYELMRAVLDAHKDIDAIFSHNDSMTLGIIDAMKERGLKPGSDIVIVTIDAEQAAIDALIRGELNCVIECNPKQGPGIIELALALARGEKIDRFIHVEERVFYEGDDLSDLEPRGY